jgi:MinD-like ATPase involved in chromosome partitioning or flagellar assembly
MSDALTSPACDVAPTVQVIGARAGAGATTVCEILTEFEKTASFFDAGSGIENCSYDKITPASQTLLVIDDQDAESLDAAVEMIRGLGKTCKLKRVGVVVNKMSDASRARAIFRSLESKLGRFSSVRIEYFGHVPAENLIKSKKDHSAAGCLRLMAKRLIAGAVAV